MNMNIQSFSRSFFITLLMVAGAAKAECVVDGMNLWQLAECIACSAGAYFEVKQSSFVANVATIGASGHYKLCENVSGLTIAINTNDVILDLGGYITDGLAIVLQSGAHNIVIRNGTIRNPTGPGINLEDNNSNIVIEDIVIDTISTPLGGNEYAVAASLFVSTPANGLLIRNMTVYNGSFHNFRLKGSNITLENITCIQTDPVFIPDPVPTNPNGIIYIIECNNLVMKNITLTDQYQELNGIWLDTCSNIMVDGVTITSSLPAPTMNAPVAYTVSDSVNGIHKNMLIDGGENTVFDSGINCSGSSSTHIFDACDVTRTTTDGISLASDNTVLNSTVSFSNEGFVFLGSGYGENCIAENNSLTGYTLEGASITLKNCSAFNTGTTGFSVAGANSQLNGCVADNNGSEGFDITANNCSLDGCSANNNVSDGFAIRVTDGCFITNSIANDNASGFLATSIRAESTFSGGVPVNNNTWNIGQFPPTNPANVNNHNIRLANNIALRNSVGGFMMSGTVFDTASASFAPFFPTPIFPPIGVVNTVQGVILVDSKPRPDTAIGASTGLVSPPFANTVGGNLVNDKP